METKLDQLFKEFLRQCECECVRPATIQSYQDSYRLLIKLVPEIKIPRDLSKDKIIEFFELLRSRKRIIGNGKIVSGVKDSTIRTYWSKLNTFFAWLETEKHINNPLVEMKKPQVYYSDAKALRKEKIERIYTSISLNSQTPLMEARDRLIVSLLFYLGVRKTELLSLRIMDIDTESKLISIQGATSKSKRTRRLPLNHELMNHLKRYLIVRKEYKTEMLLVSLNKDSGITKHGIKHWVRRINKLSGVKFHLHMFRHTFACNLVKNKIDMPKLMMLMGHTDLRMTQRYLRSLDAEDLRGVVNELSIGTAW
jgi:integrase